MMVCASCGGRNDAGAAFCGDCGAFLEWTGTPEQEEEPTPEAAEDAALAEALPEAAAGARSGAASEPPAGRPVEPVAGGTGPVAGGTGPVAGGTAPGDAPRVPAAVLPGEAVRRRPRRQPASPRPPVAGEVACPGCGAGNDRARRFCRSCGVPLQAPARERVSWWRRLVAWRSRRRTVAAGTRRRVRPPRRLPRKLLALGLVGGLVAVLAGPGREAATGVVDRAQLEVRDQLAKPAPVTPTGWEASSSLPDHEPEQLAVRVADQFWAPDGEPAGSWVEAELPRPVRLLYVVIHAGQSADPELFQQQGRPYQVEVTAISDDGGTVSADLAVRDQPGPQEFAVKADRVVRVRFVFHSAHGMEPDRFMAVGELEFFTR